MTDRPDLVDLSDRVNPAAPADPVDTAASAADRLAVGDVIEVEIGPVAHGGHCVARYEGRVLFVRLGLPGETAMVRVTEVRSGSFCRAEVVQVLAAHPSRITAPCVHFRPAGCGGCDFQHASSELQRELKATVVAEQLHRLAGLDLPVVVEPIPEPAMASVVGSASGRREGAAPDLGPGFGWRTRVRWALDDEGRIGPRAARSHQVVAASAGQPCLIAAPGISELAAVLDVPAGVRGPSPVRPSGPRKGKRAAPTGRAARAGRRDLPEVVLLRTPEGQVRSVWPGQDPGLVRERAAGHEFQVAGNGFWQVHPVGADTLASAVREALSGLSLQSAWDLYGGVGLFAAVLADALGPDGSVVTVEGDRQAAELAEANLAHLPGVESRHGPVAVVLATLPERVDAIVLDPPRTGAGAALCADLAARTPAVIVYVACDPAALARDAAALAAVGYRLDTLRAFDCFPQTHHVECVARFVPA